MMPSFRTVAWLLALALLTGGAPAQERRKPGGPPIPDADNSVVRQVRPGLWHISRVTTGPRRINVLLIDTQQPGLSIRANLSNGLVAGTEKVSAMCARTGAVAGVNGDLWGNNGVEQGLLVVNGRLLQAPKCRSVFGLDINNRPSIERYIDSWGWSAWVTAPDSSTQSLVLINSDLNSGWMCMYTPEYGLTSGGTITTPSAEVVVDATGLVTQVRVNQLRVSGSQPRLSPPAGGYILAARGAAQSDWLSTKLPVGSRPRFDYVTPRPITSLRQAISGGPRIIIDGTYYEDPVTNPWQAPSEEFEPSWKMDYYYNRHPRTAVGYTQDRRYVIFMTIDGRMSQYSIGATLGELAWRMLEYGAYQAMNMDGGGSTTMVVGGKLVNMPSDNASPNGTGGVERAVANGWLIFSN